MSCSKPVIEAFQNGPIGSRTPSSSWNRYQHAAMPSADEGTASTSETRATNTSSTAVRRPSEVKAPSGSNRMGTASKAANVISTAGGRNPAAPPLPDRAKPALERDRGRERHQQQSERQRKETGARQPHLAEIEPRGLPGKDEPSER